MRVIECTDPQAPLHDWTCVWLEADVSPRVGRELGFPGVYRWIEIEPQPTGLTLYVGQSYNLQARLSDHFRLAPNADGFLWRGLLVRRPCLYVRRVDDRRTRLALEAATIATDRPRFNRLFPVVT